MYDVHTQVHLEFMFIIIFQLRDLRHENLNPYVGFLVDPERPAIVTEYCSRGSLKVSSLLHCTFNV